MSAETNYLQQFIDKKWAFETDPRFAPSVTGLGRKMQLGVEITVVEANQAYAYWENGHFNASISPGQKSYIVSYDSAFLHAFTGYGHTTGRLRTLISTRVGLRFPESTNDTGERFFAYPPGLLTWQGQKPWQNDDSTRIQSVEVSLVPFRTGTSLNPRILETPDGRVHIRITRVDRQVIVLSEVKYDTVTHQLSGYSGTMERVDFASMWILSFFIAPGTIE